MEVDGKSAASLDKDPPLDRKKERKEVNLKVPPCKASDLQTSSDSVFGPIHEEEEDEDDEMELQCPEAFPGIYAPCALKEVDEVFVKTEAKLLGFAPPISSNHLMKEVVSIENADFSWEEDRHDHTLDDITTKIPAGKLTIVVGSIGSGKSSLISAILGEIKLMKGEVRWGRYVKYEDYNSCMFNNC